jgi:hypothetical protein
LSPDGRRLACLSQYQESERDRFNGEFCLWTADLDGSNRVEVGRMQDRSGRDDNNGHPTFSWPRELRWLPSGNHLSFVLDKRLFVVAAQ